MRIKKKRFLKWSASRNKIAFYNKPLTWLDLEIQFFNVFAKQLASTWKIIIIMFFYV